MDVVMFIYYVEYLMSFNSFIGGTISWIDLIHRNKYLLLSIFIPSVLSVQHFVC